MKRDGRIIFTNALRARKSCVMETMKSVGTRIKELRMERNISQQQLADMMYVSRRTVGNWETGFRLPDVVMLHRLSQILGVEAHTFFDASQGEAQAMPVILLVEDEPVLLKGTLRILNETLPGAQMQGFLDETKALALAQSGCTISVAFLDIELGGTSGLELADRLMEINPKINVFFLTSHPEYSIHAWDRHPCGYILKPLTPDKIRREMKHLRYPVPGLTIQA